MAPLRALEFLFFERLVALFVFEFLFTDIFRFGTARNRPGSDLAVTIVCLKNELYANCCGTTGWAMFTCFIILIVVWKF